MLLLSLAPITLEAVRGPNPLREPPRLAPANREELQDLLRLLGSQRPQGDYCFDFKLRHFPRRGPFTDYRGRLWGGADEAGSLNRIHLDIKDSPQDLVLLLQRGPYPRAWKLDADGEPRELSQAEWFEPLLPGVLYAPFHILMPFIYWENWESLPPERVKGRPARQFLMFPPEGYRVSVPELKAIRMALDAKFNALLRADLIDMQDRSLLSFKVLTFKKVQELWIPRSIDLVDTTTRDKTRFQVEAAALNLQLPPEIFTPQGLKADPPLIPIERFDFFP